MIIGYARISTGDGNLELQREVLRSAFCAKIYEETMSGARRDRPQLEAMLNNLREGDVVVAARLDRIARSTRHLLEIAERLNEIGAGLRSIGEPWADTTSPAGRMILTVFAGIAEFERSLIISRTSNGRKAAKANGVRFGRPFSLTPDQVDLGRRLLADGNSVRAAASLIGVHHATLYRALARGDSNPVAELVMRKNW